MTKRYLNLLPQQYRFDIKKYAAVKILIAICIANFLLLIFLYAIDRYNQVKLESVKREKANKIEQMTKLNASFAQYEMEKKNMETTINQLNVSENLYTSLFNTKHSAFINIIRTLKLITDGIQIQNITYSEGTVHIAATAQNTKKFYQFYKQIENTEYIKDKKFSNLTKLQDNTFSFNLIITFRGLDG
ncbi:MAG: hypothetical protein N3C60_08650 [Calditerrivibrio sp.]|nr:hypothetical protein [Calditerrivibrio sp.]